MGQLVKEQINARMTVRHPTLESVQGLHFCTFRQDGDRPDSLYRAVHDVIS